MSRSFWGLSLVVLLIAAGCGSPEEGERVPDDGPVIPPLALAHSDIEALGTLDLSGAYALDGFTDHAFSAIFSDATPAAVRHYFDQRISHVLDAHTRASIAPSRFRYTAWSRDDELQTHMHNAKAEVGAVNIGAALWLSGFIDQTPVTLTVDFDTIRIRSPRTGIMLIGPGYKGTETVGTRKIDIPAGYRQAILIHEARHSDCTGGIAPTALAIARQATSQRLFTETFPSMSCGHLHAYCPDGHQFAGIPACDKEPWGAYAVAGVFEKALSLSPADEIPRHILLAAALDSMSRVLVDTDDLLSGKLGRPDMSSAELDAMGDAP